LKIKNLRELKSEKKNVTKRVREWCNCKPWWFSQQVCWVASIWPQFVFLQMMMALRQRW